MPVLALAIVVEARAIIQRWADVLPTWVRTVQGVIWAVPLLLFVVVEDVAFNELAGHSISSAWVTVAGTAISLGMGVLIFAPALDLLVRSNAWAIARGIFAAREAPIRWKSFRLSYQLKRLLRQTRKETDRTAATMKEITMMEDQIRGWPDAAESQETLAKVSALRQKILIAQEKEQEAKQRLIKALAQLDSAKGNLAEARKAIVADVGKHLAREGFYG
jgi:hypothetical protein